jgi:adenylyl-sulfate kinase
MNKHGFVVWFTGLPGSGKSTLARLLKEALQQQGLRSEILDGDEIRKRLTKGLGYSRADREENINRIAFVAGLLARVGGVAITAAISPYRTSRDQARKEIPNFIEVHVQCPLEECIRRDPKGLYAKATRGEIQNFTGISDPYEEPQNPEITLLTDQQTPEECIQLILKKLKDLRLIFPTLS